MKIKIKIQQNREIVLKLLELKEKLNIKLECNWRRKSDVWILEKTDELLQLVL